jgi:hypothetical protein
MLPGSKSKIVWLYFRGDVANYPLLAEYPFKSDMLYKWTTWTMDLLDDEERVVLNVMRKYCYPPPSFLNTEVDVAPTNSAPF